MDAGKLRERQAPLKKRFRESPETACQTLTATGEVVLDRVICEVNGYQGAIPAGLHRFTGGDGDLACSAELLLESLVGCAGVTLGVVAKALGIALDRVQIRAEGDLDFRGTLGVDKDVPVGFRAIRLRFDIDSQADEATLDKLLELTDRYCVVSQTLSHGVPVRLVR